MNLIHKLFNPADMYSGGAYGASIFEPRPSDTPRSSLEAFLAEVAERVQKTPVNGGKPERKPASLDMVESSSSTPLMKPLEPSESQSSKRAPKISYVTQHALPRIGTWKSTTACSLSAPNSPSLHGASPSERSSCKDQCDEHHHDKLLLTEYYENLTKLHAMEARLRDLDEDLKGMQVMQKTRILLGQQPLFIDQPLWDRHRQSLDEQLDRLQFQNQTLRSHCIKRGLLLLPNPSAFSRSASISTGRDSGKVLSAYGTPTKSRHRSTTLPAAIVEQAVTNHRTDRKRIPRAARTILEYHFSLCQQPSEADMDNLAEQTALPIRKIRTWFITKRAVCMNPP